MNVEQQIHQIVAVDLGGPKSTTCFFNIPEKKMPGGETACFAPTWTRGDFLSR
jgi:hypothetical protein